jgi:hypothetical protein
LFRPEFAFVSASEHFTMLRFGNPAIPPEDDRLSEGPVLSGVLKKRMSD